MKMELIKTDQYWLVCSDEEIKVGDWFYCSDRTNYSYTFQCFGLTNDTHLKVKSDNEFGYGDWDISYSKKIIYHRPLNNAPVLEGVPLLPEWNEEDVEKLAEDYTERWCSKRRVDNYIHDAFIAGYKAATKTYSGDDLKDAFNAGYDLNTWEQLEIPNEERDYCNEHDYIQSLKQSKEPKYFIPEMEETVIYNASGLHSNITCKTTTNSLGQTVVIGKYE